LEEDKMVKKEAEKLAAEHSYYSTDYIEILLINNDNNVEKVKEILSQPTEDVVKEVRQGLKMMRIKRQNAWNKILNTLERV
jgi:hypothetical protein